MEGLFCEFSECVQSMLVRVRAMPQGNIIQLSHYSVCQELLLVLACIKFGHWYIFLKSEVATFESCCFSLQIHPVTQYK